MVGFEDVERKCCFRAVEGCGVPTHTEELAVAFVGDATHATFTESDLYHVPTVGIDDGELMVRGACGAWIAIVSKIADVPERIEGGSVKKGVLPALDVVSIEITRP